IRCELWKGKSDARIRRCAAVRPDLDGDSCRGVVRGRTGPRPPEIPERDDSQEPAARRGDEPAPGGEAWYRTRLSDDSAGADRPGVRVESGAGCRGANRPAGHP